MLPSLLAARSAPSGVSVVLSFAASSADTAATARPGASAAIRVSVCCSFMVGSSEESESARDVEGHVGAVAQGLREAELAWRAAARDQRLGEGAGLAEVIGVGESDVP